MTSSSVSCPRPRPQSSSPQLPIEVEVGGRRVALSARPDRPTRGSLKQQTQVRPWRSGRRRSSRATDDPERYAFFDHSPFIGLWRTRCRLRSCSTTTSSSVTGRVTFRLRLRGPAGLRARRVCGCGVRRAARCATQSLSGSQGMTARLIVNYRAPTPLKTDLTMVGSLVSARRDGSCTAKGRLFAGDTLCAEGGGAVHHLRRREVPGSARAAGLAGLESVRSPDELEHRRRPNR